MRIITLFLLCCGLCAASNAKPFTLDIEDLRKKVQTELRSGILDFWLKHSIDKDCGGYITGLAEDGSWSDAEKKYLLTQTRLVWFFSKAHRHGIVDRPCLEMATHGYEFLIKHMWDKENGGFYWLVDRQGEVVKDRKSIYTQTFAIYALSEYYLASKNKEALAYAEKLFDLYESKARDGSYGYLQNFNRDWTLRGERQHKTLDVHMHIMECYTTLYEASGKEKHKQALKDIIALLMEKSINKEHGSAYEPYNRQFEPINGRGGEMTTSYGHNVELGWLLLEALRVLGADREDYKKEILGLVDHALRCGFDQERGGVAMYGPHAGHSLEAKQFSPLRLRKSWWEQSELIVALLESYAWTGEEQYGVAFKKTFDWIWKHHRDQQHGGWYSMIDWEGTQVLNRYKGGGWKSPYHNGRALIMLENRLSALSKQQ